MRERGEPIRLVIFCKQTPPPEPLDALSPGWRGSGPSPGAMATGKAPGITRCSIRGRKGGCEGGKAMNTRDCGRTKGGGRDPDTLFQGRRVWAGQDGRGVGVWPQKQGVVVWLCSPQVSYVRLTVT